MQFQDLKLIPPLLRAVQAEGYTDPTPIQIQAIPHVLQGRDVIACAQTGTGKTAAFALPILQELNTNTAKRNIRVLVLTPTRELATQIGDSFSTYGHNLGFRNHVIFGGVSQHSQVKALRRGLDILIATPGRLLDLMGQGEVHLNSIEIFVLDEADRMLDMGFIHDINRVIDKLPRKRQTLLFSATMPQDIQELANRILINPVHVEVTPQATTVEKIDQSVFFVANADKKDLLEHLLQDRTVSRVLVFTRTKHRADTITKKLGRNRISAEAIHGNKSQNARERALDNFKSGRTRVLVATDIAARGLDIDDVTHVINFDLPNIPESYVHRIGRTARAGASGIAYSFCDAEETEFLRDIEKVTRQTIAIVTDHPYAQLYAMPVEKKPQPKQNQSGNNKSSNGNRNRNRNRRRRSNKQLEQ
jgi:ATP-dependent RNA helicase RhlE